MAWQLGIWLMIALLLPGGVLLAAEPEAGETAPKLDVFGGDWGTAIFTLLVFIVLLGILGKWAWGPLLDGLKKREDHIRHSIEEADLAREEAFLSLRQHEQRMARVQTEAQELIDQSRAEAVKLTEQLKQDARREADSFRRQSQQDIAAARDQALRQICDQAVVLTTDLAGRIISKSLDPEDHRRLLQESVVKLRENVREN